MSSLSFCFSWEAKQSLFFSPCFVSLCHKQAMEETEESSGNKKCTTKTKTFRGRANTHKHHYHQYQYHYHYQHQLLQYSNQFGFFNQNQYYPGYYPALLPLPPPIPLQLALTPPLPQNHSSISKTQLQKPLCKLNNPPPPPTSSETRGPAVTASPGNIANLKPPSVSFFFLLFFVLVIPLYACMSFGSLYLLFLSKDSWEILVFFCFELLYYQVIELWQLFHFNLFGYNKVV